MTNAKSKQIDKFNKNNSLKASQRSEIIFLVCLLVIPIAIFLLCYVYVNISSIFLAFKGYDSSSGKYFWIGTENIKKVINDLIKNPVLSRITKRSLISYAATLFIAFPLNIIFAFVIYKKIPFAGFFQIVLFLPSILSTIVIALMFKQFVDFVVPDFLRLLGIQNPPNLLFDNKTAFGMQIFFTIWAGFGTQLLLYSGAMSRIPESIIEVGKLEGLGMFKELWYITIPMIFPTITIFLVTGVASIFISQLALFSFYGTNAREELHTLGYYFFVMVIGQNATLADYPYAAAGGLVFTFVAVPLTLLVRYLLEKFGPTVEF